MRMIGIALFTLIFLNTQALTVTNELEVLTELGSWNVKSIGAMPSVSAVDAFSSPSKAIANALAAAKAADYATFCNCFWDLNASNAPASMKRWFEELQTSSRQYKFLIVDIAILKKRGSNGVVAVSIAPVAPLMDTDAGRKAEGVLKPNVIFTRTRNDQSKLVWDLTDESLKEELLARALPLVYQRDLNRYESLQQEEEAARKRNLMMQSTIVQQMQDKGMAASEIAGVKQSFQLQRTSVTVTNWESWKKHFKANILTPPIGSDMREAAPIDFSDPVRACLSYRRALYRGDGKTLLKYSDETGRQWLEKTLNVDDKGRNSYEVFPKLTQYVLLLTATASYEGKEYVLVFFRAQEGVNPKNGMVTFQVDFFKRVGNDYVLTRDLGPTSPFGNVLGAAKVRWAMLAPYSKFFENSRNSELPPHFYSIP